MFFVKPKILLDRNPNSCYNDKAVTAVYFEILAQLAEHTPFKRRVEGSNPSYLTKNPYPVVVRIFCFYFDFQRTHHLMLSGNFIRI